MPLVLGGVGVVVVIVLFLALSSKGKDADAGSKQDAPKAAAEQPAAAPASTLKAAAAKGGKTPDQPAPALTMATLEQVRAMLQEAKALSNEGVTLMKSGETSAGQAKQSAAAAKILALKELIQPQLDWQELAETENWAQPSEYMTLTSMWPEISGLEKKVRMGGGKR